MSKIISLPQHSDHRGNLFVIQNEIGFIIKRVFYIRDVPRGENRGGHRHFGTKLALICLNGSCHIHIKKNDEKQSFELNNPAKCLIIESHEWHELVEFTADAIVLVLASEEYDPLDYSNEVLCD